MWIEIVINIDRQVPTREDHLTTIRAEEPRVIGITEATGRETTRGTESIAQVQAMTPGAAAAPATAGPQAETTGGEGRATADMLTDTTIMTAGTGLARERTEAARGT